MGRPTKEEKLIIEERNKDIKTKYKNGYKYKDLCLYFNLTKGRMSHIIKGRK